MSSYTSNKNRLWVQVMPSCEIPSLVMDAKGGPVAILVDFMASGIGAIIKSAGDRLVNSDQHVMKTVVAYEPGFVIRANAISASFLLNCITLNVGPKVIPIRDGKTGLPLSLDVITKSSEYEQCPVVIRLEFVESTDGTAVAAQITHWKYNYFLDPSPTPSRTPRRKITIELKISDVDNNVLLVTVMQIEANSEELGNERPNDGERLPWMKRPVKNLSSEQNLAQDQFFGPVNIEVSITEVAEPSRFAKFFGTFLGNQKTAIETFVKDRLTQVLDESAAGKRKLDLLKEASTALEEYKKNYDMAVKARSNLDAASKDDIAAWDDAKQRLALQLAILHQQEVLTRGVFDRAQLSFTPLPVIKGS